MSRQSVTSLCSSDKQEIFKAKKRRRQTDDNGLSSVQPNRGRVAELVGAHLMGLSL